MLSRRRRTSRRNYIPRPMKKYSVENTSLWRNQTYSAPFTAQTFAYDIIPALNTYGVRKIKNISLQLTLSPIPCSVLWAVIYLPEGLGTPDDQKNLYAKLNSPDNYMASIYEPNQNVIMAGILPSSPSTTSTPTIIRRMTRLARNLSSGDRVQLAFNISVPAESGLSSYSFTCSALTTFAVAFS